ncbi:fasciclin-1 isoform X2 [Orussus abietinus]|uniref:fasciclin-1 isoform X2 n=1 Tax=Orussus abietinus TaxID=222816 RepID=UPI000626A5A4|nr:fasciclin-1 isoform X2 [Orussus abietinus]
MCSASVALFAVLAVLFASTDATTVEGRIREDSDLSQFYQLLEASHVANTSLNYRQVTIFAPTNLAFQKYNRSTDDIVLYHMTNLALTTDQLGDSVSSELEGNPPLWITKKRGPYGEEEVYINNAKILNSRSNFKSSIRLPGSKDTKDQVLHTISEVLEPLVSTSTDAPLYKPNAFQFLNQSENFNMDNHRIRNFRQRVFNTKKENVFKGEGRYTFLIPVDEGFKPTPRPRKVDAKVIDGHVIPNHVLFTAPTPNETPFETLAFSDNLKVTISFSTEHDGKETRTYVKSNTLLGDNDHATGVVLAEIVKANIPVRNGVVHLIQRPLMIVDSTVVDFLKEKEDGPVYKFYKAVLDHAEDFMNTLTKLPQVTLFAPNNAAWDEAKISHVLQDKERLMNILKLHYVQETLPLEKILNRGVNQNPTLGSSLFEVPTAAEKKSLYFNVVQGPTGNQTLTVEGGGVNATVVTPNIAATNGVIHIIDRVFGVPYITVLDKLRTDPSLNSTYYLGTLEGFNAQLNDTTKRFTYFAPRNYAWEAAKISYPSTYKKIFMPEYRYQSKQILERHLVVADQAYKMSQLKAMSHNGSVALTSVRDNLKLRVRELDDSYYVEWREIRIRVSRSDVECTNGIIHVIDTVFMTDSDVRVPGGATVATLAPHLLMILIAKWLL